MATPVILNLPDVRMVIGNPSLIHNDKTTLRFDFLLRRNNATILRIPGWRIKAGQILPPSRRIGAGYVNVVEVPQPELIEKITKAVALWEASFPEVVFPLVGQNLEPDDTQFAVVE